MSTRVVDDQAAERFEIFEGDQLAGHLAYTADGGVLDLYSTQVAPEFGGRGLAGQLVSYALDQARAADLKVRPTCSYVRAYVDKRAAQYGDLIASD